EGMALASEAQPLASGLDWMDWNALAKRPQIVHMDKVGLTSGLVGDIVGGLILDEIKEMVKEKLVPPSEHSKYWQDRVNARLDVIVERSHKAQWDALHRGAAEREVRQARDEARRDQELDKARENRDRSRREDIVEKNARENRLESERKELQERRTIEEMGRRFEFNREHPQHEPAARETPIETIGRTA
ncbi:MAG TPA: hypothetical protein PKA13_05860, partial [Geminicoccaceae bacterium]|nr:hypothetical protein [Geminicoccus sp.]HMU49280.1 hypothetical protein [Geminicoccaceae bacterium]